ncbi:MAG: PQQ-binding-like beta-propeller repeat protein, partial [Pirellulales bacterium]
MDVESSNKAGPARRIRWVWLLVILGAGGVLLGGLQVPDLFSTDQNRNLATISASLLVGGFVVLWLILGTGLAWRKRITLLVAAAAAAVGFVICVRVEGFSGNLSPRLGWRWAAKHDESLTFDLFDDRRDAAEHADLTQTSEHDFPQFLGPQRDATVEAPAFARDWPAHPPRKLWRKAIGAGWSSFAVVGRHALTQEQRGNLEMVTCYNALTGEPLWWHADEGRFSATISGDGPRATPTIVDGRVYTLGALGTLNCLDGGSGELLWSHNVIKENGASKPEWGKSCSPLVVGDLVIVSAGGPDGHSLVAYDKQTGEMAWHGGDQPSSYASPRLVRLAGAEQILIVNQTAVTAHDPDDGHVLWNFDWAGGEPKVADAVAVDGDRVFIAAGYGLGCKLLKIASTDGRLSARVAWQNTHLRPKFANVVVHDGHVFGLDDGKALACLELKSGKRRWRGGRYGHGQILLVNDLLLVQAESGEVVLVEASPERFKELT